MKGIEYLNEYLDFVRKTVPCRKDRVDERIKRIENVLVLKMKGWGYRRISNEANMSKSYAKIIVDRYKRYLNRPCFSFRHGFGLKAAA